MGKAKVTHKAQERPEWIQITTVSAERERRRVRGRGKRSGKMDEVLQLTQELSRALSECASFACGGGEHWPLDRRTRGHAPSSRCATTPGSLAQTALPPWPHSVTVRPAVFVLVTSDDHSPCSACFQYTHTCTHTHAHAHMCTCRQDCKLRGQGVSWSPGDDNGACCAHIRYGVKTFGTRSA